MATLAHRQKNQTELSRRPIWISGKISIDLARSRFWDLRRVALLQRRCFRRSLAYRPSTLLLLHLWPRATFLLARAGDEIVGCVIGDVQGGQSRVVSICVDPAWRRQGIGALLLAEIEKQLPDGNLILMVESGNDSAQQLYRRAGYLTVGESNDYYGRGRSGIWMQKMRRPTGS